jgi:uncharacterized membrane protein YGL010W
MLTVVGFFWCIPRPAFFQNIPYLNWGTIFLVLCLAFYFTLNMMMFIGMTVQAIVMSVICEYIYRTGNLLPFCIIVFVIAWIGQFYGHKVEGKKPSFLDDLVFLLIGPLWVTRFFYKKIGINV